MEKVVVEDPHSPIVPWFAGEIMSLERKSNRRQSEPSDEPAANERNYIIQVFDRGTTFSMQDAKNLLSGLGVVLDHDYGPITLNREKGQYVLRGKATQKAREDAERSISGIRFFGDAKVGPMGPPA